MNYVDELKSIPGVGSVQEFGSDFGMRIWLDPAKMAQNKVTAVASAVSRIWNRQVAAGNVGTAPVDKNQAFQYIVTVQGV